MLKFISRFAVMQIADCKVYFFLLLSKGFEADCKKRAGGKVFTLSLLFSLRRLIREAER